MKRNKFWLGSAIGAVIAGLACIAVPLVLFVVGSTAISLVPAWLDYVLVPVFVVLTAISIYYWYHNRRPVKR